MFKVMAVSHVQGDDRGGGREFGAIGHVQGDGRGLRGVSNVQGDGRG